MNKTSATATLKNKLGHMLAALGKVQPFIIGTLVEIKRKCGNPKCRCALQGKKHSAHILTTKVNGKTQSIYVPVDMVEEVRQWCAQYSALKSDIKEVSECCEQLIRLYSKEKRAKSGK